MIDTAQGPVIEQPSARSVGPINVSSFVSGRSFFFYLLTGWLLQLVYSVSLALSADTVATFATRLLITFCILWFVGSAGYFFGMIGGFLFGLPRAITAPPSADLSIRTRDNTNLEEISDWLTKIIVGLGLVNFSKGLALIDRFGNFVGNAVAPDPESANGAYILAVTSVSYGFSCGFLFFYMWSRSEFARFLNR